MCYKVSHRSDQQEKGQWTMQRIQQIHLEFYLFFIFFPNVRLKISAMN